MHVNVVVEMELVYASINARERESRRSSGAATAGGITILGRERKVTKGEI